MILFIIYLFDSINENQIKIYYIVKLKINKYKSQKRIINLIFKLC